MPCGNWLNWDLRVGIKLQGLVVAYTKVATWFLNSLLYTIINLNISYAALYFCGVTEFI